MILCVVFVVFMIFWAVGMGSGWQDNPPAWARYSSGIFPWVCVAILGYIAFSGGIPGGPVR